MSERMGEIRDRLKAATRGPWRWDGHRVPTLVGRGGDPDIYEYDTEVIEATHGGECGCRSVCTLDLEVGPRDAELIAHAPEDIAWLVGEVERLLTANDRLARIASEAAVQLERGKHDLMAHAWKRGVDDWLNGRANNPYIRVAPDA